jgi:hypothetical protein
LRATAASIAEFEDERLVTSSNSIMETEPRPSAKSARADSFSGDFLSRLNLPSTVESLWRKISASEFAARPSLDADDGVFGPKGPWGNGFTPSGNFFTPKQVMDSSFYRLCVQIALCNPFVRFFMKYQGPFSDFGPIALRAYSKNLKIDPRYYIWGPDSFLGVDGVFGMFSGAIGALDAYGYQKQSNGTFLEPDGGARAMEISVGNVEKQTGEPIEYYKKLEDYLELARQGQLDNSFVLEDETIRAGEDSHTFPLVAFQDQTLSLMVRKTVVGAANPLLEVYNSRGEIGHRVDREQQTNITAFRAKKGEVYFVRVGRPPGSQAPLQYRFGSQKHMDDPFTPPFKLGDFDLLQLTDLVQNPPIPLGRN